MHVFVAPWLHTYRTSLGTGKRTALDAVLLLTRALPPRCRGARRAPGGGGPGLVLLRLSMSRVSNRTMYMLLRRLTAWHKGRSTFSLHIIDLINLIYKSIITLISLTSRKFQRCLMQKPHVLKYLHKGRWSTQHTRPGSHQDPHRPGSALESHSGGSTPKKNLKRARRTNDMTIPRFCK